MAKYVPDINTKRWVIIAPIRKARPNDSKENADASSATRKEAKCPFCSGNESLTPPEIYRVGGGEMDKTGWLVRVVPNKYPITDLHEVIIHSPEHAKDIEKLPLEQVVHIVSTYRERYRANKENGHVLIFCNHGLHAGASLSHPHSQLVVVPRQINLDAISREPIANIVEENTFFITYCPDFSQWPYEVWIAPKIEGRNFGDLADSEVPDLAQVIQRALQRIVKVYEQDTSVTGNAPGIPLGYNYYIDHSSSWFIRIIPRFVHRAGFELGTGLNVNIVDPIDAAENLKNSV